MNEKSHYFWIDSPANDLHFYTDKKAILDDARALLVNRNCGRVVIAWGEVYDSRRPPLLKRTWIIQIRKTLQHEPVEVDDGLGGQLMEQVEHHYIDTAGFERSTP